MWYQPWEPDRRAGAPLGRSHPTHRAGQGHYLLTAGGGRRSPEPGSHDAVRYYTQALDLAGRGDHPDPVLRIDLAIGLGTAQRQTGDPAFRETLLETAHRAADLGDTKRLVAAAMANDRGFSVLGNVDADKVEILELALGRLPEYHPDRALVLAKLCEALTYGSPLERRQALADEAIAIAEASGDDATMVRVLNDISYPLLVPQLLEQSLSHSADAMALAERLGDPVLTFWAASQRHTAAACSGNIDEVDRCLEILGELAAQLNQPTLNWRHLIMRSTRAQLAGDPTRAEELANEAFQIGNDGGEPDAAALFGAQMMSVTLQRGTLGELIPLIEQVAAEHPGVTPFMAALAMAHVENGQIDAACGLLQTFFASGLDLPVDATWTIGMNCYAEAAIECRDRTCAAPMLDRLRPWADRLSYSGVSAAGPVNHVLAGLASVLGRFDEADAYFVQSSELSTRIGAKFFLGAHEPRLGEDARRTPCARRPRPRPRPPGQGARRRGGPRVRSHRTQGHRCPPTGRRLTRPMARVMPDR